MRDRMHVCKRNYGTHNSDVTKDWTGSDACEHSAGWGQIGGTAML